MKSAAVQPKHFPWFDYSRYSFSLGIDAGAHVYLSGHTASEYDPDIGRMVVKGDIGAQTRTAYAKIGAILEGAGKTYEDVVRIVEYVRPEVIERYGEAAAVRNEVSAHTVRQSIRCRSEPCCDRTHLSRSRSPQVR